VGTGKTVTVRCDEIKESSAVVSIEGIEGTRELRLSPQQFANPDPEACAHSPEN